MFDTAEKSVPPANTPVMARTIFRNNLRSLLMDLALVPLEHLFSQDKRRHGHRYAHQYDEDLMEGREIMQETLVFIHAEFMELRNDLPQYDEVISHEENPEHHHRRGQKHGIQIWPSGSQEQYKRNDQPKTHLEHPEIDRIRPAQHCLKDLRLSRASGEAGDDLPNDHEQHYSDHERTELGDDLHGAYHGPVHLLTGDLVPQPGKEDDRGAPGHQGGGDEVNRQIRAIPVFSAVKHAEDGPEVAVGHDAGNQPRKSGIGGKLVVFEM